MRIPQASTFTRIQARSTCYFFSRRCFSLANSFPSSSSSSFLIVFVGARGARCWRPCAALGCPTRRPTPPPLAAAPGVVRVRCPARALSDVLCARNGATRHVVLLQSAGNARASCFCFVCKLLEPLGTLEGCSLKKNTALLPTRCCFSCCCPPPATSGDPRAGSNCGHRRLRGSGNQLGVRGGARVAHLREAVA